MKTWVGKTLTKNLIDNPIFVAGIGRSGTSVLLKAMGHHPQVLPSGGEAPMIRSFGELVGYLKYSEDREFYAKTLNVPQDYFLRNLRRLCFEYVVGTNYGLHRCLTSVRAGELAISGKRHWCAKVLPKVEQYFGLLGLYPGAKVLYIVRNGLEVVHSRTKFHGFRHLPFESHCRTWTESIEGYPHLLDADDTLLLRHDQLVSDPDTFFDTVFKFLDMEPHPGPIDFVKNTMMIPLDEETKSNVDVKQLFEGRQPPYANWTAEERESFVRIAGNAMRILGFEIPFSAGQQA